MPKKLTPNKDLRFPIHKIAQIEKKPPKNKICPQNKDLRFPPNEKIPLKNKFAHEI